MNEIEIPVANELFSLNEKLDELYEIKNKTNEL